MVKIWITPTLRYPVPVPLIVPKIQCFGKSTGAVGEIWMTPTGDILCPCEQSSAKLANIRVPSSTCDSRQWWSMPLFLFTQHTIVVENNNAAIRACVRGDGGHGAKMLEPTERRNRPLVAYIFPQNR